MDLRARRARARPRRRPRTRWASSLIFPLIFASSVYVPVATMPDGLREFAEANPFTTWTDALRSLWLGTPAHTDVWMSVIWWSCSWGVRAARGGALPPRRRPLAGRPTSLDPVREFTRHSAPAAAGGTRRRIARRVIWRALAAVVAVAVLVPAAPARAPARARASAVVIGGSLGELGRIRVSGDALRTLLAPVDKAPAGVVLRSGDATVVSVRGTGNASARATGAARSISLLGGAVTACGVRRTAVDHGDGSGPAYSGIVRGLRVDGRLIGDAPRAQWIDLASGGFVEVNRGGVGLRVKLTAPLNGFPAGTTVLVADVRAAAADGANPAAPTPTPTATATADAHRHGDRDPTATPKPRKPRAPGLQEAAEGPVRLPGAGQRDHRRPVRRLPRRHRLPRGQRHLRRLRHAGRRGGRRQGAQGRLAADLRQPAVGYATTATRSSTPTCRRSRPPRSTGATSRPARCSATWATPATPSRRRRTCTSRSTRTAARRSTRTRSSWPGSARAGDPAPDTVERPGALVEVRDPIAAG